MENVIEEISRIDKLAFEREEQNKIALANERNKYENEIKAYREQQLKAAHIRADSICEKLIKEAKVEALAQKAESDKKVEQLKNRFSEVEQNVIDEIFAMLFIPGERR